MKSFRFLLIISSATITAGAQENLPLPEDRMEFEPKLLLIDPLPAVPERSADDNVEVLATRVQRATRRAAEGERLYKRGILAKVEAENRTLEVVRLTMELEQARLAQAEQSRQSAGTGTESEEAERVLEAARLLATEAVARWKQAELNAALLNLERQKKLVQVGAARKSEVIRAERKVAALRAAR